MTEQLQETEIASLEFIDRARLFRNEVARIATEVSGCDLFHSVKYETEQRW